MMDSGCLIFDSSSSSSAPSRGNMLLIGNGNYGFRGGGGRPVVLSMEESGGGGGGVTKRRPFFSSHEELMMEDEYYDEQLLPEKKRRLTPEQVHLLEKSFEAENKLEPDRKSELAKNLGLQPRQVAVWFQNRRARWKTKQLERDFDRLKSSYDALRADHEALLQENQHLRSQVVSLTEKLQAKEPSAGTTMGGTGGGALEKPPPSVPSSDHVGVHVGLKSEDHLSTGSGISAVVDGGSPQLVDSGDSYFPDGGGYQRGCSIGPASEEDDGSDDGGNYLSGVFAAAATAVEQQHHPVEDEANVMGWSWVWS